MPMDLAGGVLVVVVVDLPEELEGRRPRPLRRTPSTVNPLDETSLTFPVANEKFRKAEDPPGGIDPFLGKVPPLGRVPPLKRNPLPRPPAPGAPPKNPAPAPAVGQLPLESGWETVTVMALTGPVVDEPPEARGPVAVMQSPTDTAEAETVSVWVKVVVGVQLTVTWPVSGFCTSIEVPLIVATVPAADGVVGRGGSVEDVAAFEVPLAAAELQAAASTATAPSPKKMPMRLPPRAYRHGPLPEPRFESDGFMFLSPFF